MAISRRAFIGTGAAATTGVALLFLTRFREGQADPVGHSRILDPVAANEAAQTGAILLLDIRSPREWRQSGVPAPALTVTWHDPRGQYGFVKTVLDTVQGDRTRPIALICAAGVRSSRARRLLESEGFTTVYDVSEGMYGARSGPGWKARGLSLRPCDSC